MPTLVRELPGLRDAAKKDDRDLIRDLDTLFDAAKNDRAQYEGQWLVNLAFFLGQQWVVYDTLTRRLRPVRTRDDRSVKMVINRVRQQVLTKYAKLTQTAPESHAQAASDDVDDKQQAEVCDAILEYLRAVDGSEGAEMRAMLWALITGTGIFRVAWNKDAGTQLYYPETMLEIAADPVTGQETRTEIPHPRAGQAVLDKNGDPVHVGEIETQEVSPFEFYPDPFGLTMAQKSWVFIQSLRSPEYIMERYGVKVEPREYPSETFVDGQLLSLRAGGMTPKKGVAVRQFWQRSTRQYPEGRYIVYVDGQVLLQGPNPYPTAQLAISVFVDLPVPGRMWGTSIIEDMLDPQRNLNKARSQAVEIRNAHKPKWVFARTALRPEQDITNSASEIIEYDPVSGTPDGGRPRIEQAAPIPDSLWRDVDRSESEIHDVSGIHEVSNSNVPTGVGAARAIGLLQEQDDLRLGPTAKEWERAIAERDEFKLHLGKQFYDEPRTARIVGPNNAVKVVQFYKEDIPDDVDVQVVAGSSLPKSRVARQNLILSMYKLGVFAQDPQEFLRLMEMGDVQGLYKRASIHVAQAERENEQIKQGVQIAPAYRLDKHGVHLPIHNEFRVGEEFERLAAQDPRVALALEQHIVSHEQFAAAQSATLPALLAGAAGGPMPPTPPAPPAPPSSSTAPPMTSPAGAPPPGPAEGPPQAFAQ